MIGNLLFAIWMSALSGVPASAQSSDSVRQILDRLDRLEAQNRELLDEVHSLKDELAAARGNQPAKGPSVQERLEVQETRSAEQAQTKVEASQRFPIRITGMALFNTFLNSGGSGGSEYPTIAVPGEGGSAGATLSQTVVGLDYNGPSAVWGGKVRGSLRLDLFGGSGQSLDQVVRLRTGTIGIEWKNRSLFAGVDKPIISPRGPDSLAQVGISPLSGAGNLWMWVPQLRFEQDFQFTRQTGIKAQFGVIQTHESYASPSSTYGAGSASSPYYDPARPGVEARFELFSGSNRRIEIAPGLHRSVSHIAAASAPSNVYSLDWLLRPWRPLEFTGAFFTGTNVSPLGTGALRQGVILLASGRAIAVRSLGGWGQLTYHVYPRLWFNVFSGQQDDRNSDLLPAGIGKNLVYGVNLFYRLAPNVLASFETSQTRTNYVSGGALLNNHYDLAFAYLF
jgi:hypothetical protein